MSFIKKYIIKYDILKNLKYKTKLLFYIYPVDQIVGSIPEVLINENISQHITEIKIIRNACVEKYFFTTNLPLIFRAEKCFNRRHVYRMSNVFVNPRTGACFTESHAFLESFGSLRSWLLSNPERGKRDSHIIQKSKCTCVKTTGYAHFLLEEVPRLLLTLKQYPKLDIIISDKTYNFCKDIFAFLKEKNVLKHDPILILSENLLIQDFVFTQAEESSGFWHKSDVLLLRKTFLMKSEFSKKNKIYISRRYSSRSFANESRLEIELYKRGFKIVFLEQLKFRDQIVLFQNASVVIAPHGAGLANLVWCPSKTIIIEIFTSNVFNDCFTRLSSILGCDHYPIGWQNQQDQLNFPVNITLELLKELKVT